MSDALFEKVNNPIGSYPYIQTMSMNLNYISHYHESMEIVYMKSGKTAVFCGSKKIVLEKDDICFFMPGEIHSFHSAAANHLYVLKLDMNSYVEKIDFEKLRLKDNRLRQGDRAYPVFRELIDGIADEHSGREIGYEFAVRYYKNRIICAVLRELDYEFVDTSRNIRLLSEINRFLEEKYDRKTGLEEIARSCHFSKFYFAHKLKELTGMTFVQYLTAFRLEKAAALLKDNSLTVTEIAAKSGFGSLRSFNRAFVTAYNITPSEFRKQSVRPPKNY